jgi:hypothetical protein
LKAIIGRQDIPGLVIMVILGLVLTFWGYTKFKNATDSKSWPVTIGLVTGSEVAGAIKYYPSIVYTYTVDSIVYNSNSISNINFNAKNRSVVEEFLIKYPLGAKIKVYYNGSEPSKALLEPGINTGNILFLAFGIIVLAIPIFLVVFMKVDIRKV